MSSDTELAFFCLLIKQGSLVATARELNLTPPAVSRRLAQMEERLGVRLLNRTTRRISLTNEGEIYFENASRILKEIEEMEQQVARSRTTPKGLLRVNAPFGFGRTYIAPAISDFARKFPDIEVQLHLTDRPIHLPNDAIDVSIHFGQVPDSRLIAKKIAANRRLLCASPRYLAQAGMPLTPRELTLHQCIVLRQNDAAYANWRLTQGDKEETVKVHGKLSMHGVTKDIILDTKIHSVIKDFQGKQRVGFTLEGKINRKDFGLTWNKLLEGGGLTVDEVVHLVIDVEAIEL